MYVIWVNMYPFQIFQYKNVVVHLIPLIQQIHQPELYMYQLQIVKVLHVFHCQLHEQTVEQKKLIIVK